MTPVALNKGRDHGEYVVSCHFDVKFQLLFMQGLHVLSSRSRKGLSPTSPSLSLLCNPAGHCHISPLSSCSIPSAYIRLRRHRNIISSWFWSFSFNLTYWNLKLERSRPNEFKGYSCGGGGAFLERRHSDETSKSMCNEQKDLLYQGHIFGVTVLVHSTSPYLARLSLSLNTYSHIFVQR